MRVRTDADERADAAAVVAVVLALAGVRRGASVLVTGVGAALCARAAAAAATGTGRVLRCEVATAAEPPAGASDTAAAPVVSVVAASSRLPARPGVFDTVIRLACPGVDAETAAELRRVTRPGARVVVSTAADVVDGSADVLAATGFRVRHLVEAASGPGRESHLVAVRPA